MKQGFHAFKKKIRAKMQYDEYYKKAKPDLVPLLDYYIKSNKTIAVWGGGLKGDSFLGCMDSKRENIQCVVDINEALHGTFLTTGHPIVGYNYIIEKQIDVILIMNKMFFVDVYLLLKEHGYEGIILDIDTLIEQRIPYQDIIEQRYNTEAFLEANKLVFGYTMREIQSVALNILIEVDRVCQKNNITYFLEAGTALGVQRYQGFIPCDDDIDIAMLREDFEKFKKIARKELKEGFLLQYIEKGFDYPYPFLQVARDHTAFVREEFSKAKMHHGIHIDIAPLDKVPSDKELRQKQLEKIRHYSKLIKRKLIPIPYENKNILKQFIVNTDYHLLKCVPLVYLRQRQYQEFTRYSKIETDYVGDLCTHYNRDLTFHKNMLYPTVMGKFEGNNYPIPNDIDTYLSIMYEDYKRLSPRENGITNYHLKFVSLSENYMSNK